jgi:hypothetical protein
MADVPNIDYARAGGMLGPTMRDVQPAAGGYGWLQELALGLGIAGSVSSVAGTWTHLKAQQNSLRMEALKAEFAATQANMRARAAERAAALVIRAGQQDFARRGLQAAIDAASYRAQAAASGVELTGSVAEGERSLRLAAEVDKRTIRTNAELRANAVREAGANERGGGILARASAANMRASANSISPAAGAIGASMSAAGGLIGQYLAYSGRR